MDGIESRAGSERTKEDGLTRRTVIRAGWILPAVLVVSIPSKAFASYIIPDPPGTTVTTSTTITTPVAGATVGGSATLTPPSPP